MERIFGSHPEAHASCYKCIVGRADQLAGNVHLKHRRADINQRWPLFTSAGNTFCKHPFDSTTSLVLLPWKKCVECVFSGCLWANARVLFWDVQMTVSSAVSPVLASLVLITTSYVSLRGHKKIWFTSCQGAVTSECLSHSELSVSFEMWPSVHHVQYTDLSWEWYFGNSRPENKIDHLK